MTMEALKMGSYGAYVWSCYGLTLIGLLWLFFSARGERARELVRARRRLLSAAQVKTAAKCEAPQEST